MTSGCSTWCRTLACRQRQNERAVWTKGADGITRAVYVPTPKQVDFDACQSRYVMFAGAAGPGKSHAGRWRLYRRALRIPGYEALILRQTFPELENTHLRRMAREVPELGGQYLDSKRMARFPNGSIIVAGHMDDESALSRHLSTEWDDILADEASTFQPAPLLELSTRARSSKPGVKADGGAHFLPVTNPGGPAWSTLLDFFIDHTPNLDDFPAMGDEYRPEEWTFIPATLDDNPYLDPGYERALAVLRPTRYRQLRYGDLRVFDGQFFGSWDERIHVKALQIAPDVRRFGSLDWGYNAYGVWYLWACLPDGHFHLEDEYKFKETTVKDAALEIRRRCRDKGLRKVPGTAADPAIWQHTGQTGESIADTFQRFRVPVFKSQNDRQNGWQRCHELLRLAPDGTPWLTVDPSLRVLHQDRRGGGAG